MKHALLAVSAAAALAVVTAPAYAGNLLTNGNFETGDFTGWSTNVQSGSGGNLSIAPNNGGNSPISGFPYALNPGGGNFFAITDQGGPGSYSLTQSFTLTSAATVDVSFDFFANDQAGVIDSTPPNRDFTVSPNQNAEVDILTGGADAFTTTPSDIVATLYGPGADCLSCNPNPWVTYFQPLSLAAGTYQIRFAETDNQLFFQMGVDNVSVSTTVPEPATWAMMMVGFAGLGYAGLRHKQKRPASTLA